MKQLDIFGNETEVEAPKRKSGRRYRRMQELHGVMPGKTCKTCKHLYSYRRSRRWYKCGLWIRSASAATDIRLKDTACGKYEEDTDEKANG